MSAPKSNGRRKQGLKNVLSTTVRIFLDLASPMTPSRSTIFNSGFEGVSIQTIFVFEVMAFLTACISRILIKSKEIPHWENTWAKEPGGPAVNIVTGDNAIARF